MTRSKFRDDTCLISKFQPRTVKDTLEDEYWINVINEEIDQIEKTWAPIPRPKDKIVIGTKWIFRNKFNEKGKVLRNKARLVCKGYEQEEGIDYG